MDDTANVTNRDLPRQVSTGRDTEYALSIELVSECYAAAGHPRTIRTLQRYCVSGHLDAQKVATTTGDKYLVTPQSVARHLAQIEELQALDIVATDRDEGTSHLLGALLSTALATAALSRADTPEHERRPFYLYADEFQNYASNGFAVILSEARKYALSLTLGHQYLGQLPENLRQAVLGNAASFIAFRVGAEDAPLLAAHLSLRPQVETSGMGHAINGTGGAAGPPAGFPCGCPHAHR